MLKELQRYLRRGPMMFVAMLIITASLVTIATGILWCGGNGSAGSESSNIVGTWVEADDWEHGYHENQTIYEFTDHGTMNIVGADITALYRYEDGVLYLFGYQSDDTRVFSCGVTGDYMYMSENIEGTPFSRNSVDFVRISKQTGLSRERIARLY